jgi:hypothetical protein
MLMVGGIHYQKGPPPMMVAMKYVPPSGYLLKLMILPRKHLAELQYPAPRAVSKLIDEV